MGDDAFTTSTGVHAAAVVKAQARGDTRLADLVYSAVPASLIGRRQTITVGPMSGQANVVAWLRDHGIEAVPALVTAILAAAKQTTHVLSDDEMRRVIQASEIKETAI